jgi:anti-sigma factor ChrR (cupin superfamily)
VLRLPPGGVLARHAHPVVRFEVVVQGSIEAEGRTLLPGDVMVSPAGEFYGPHVAGPEGCTTVEVFSSIRGTGNVVYDTDDGPQAANYR